MDKATFSREIARVILELEGDTATAAAAATNGEEEEEIDEIVYELYRKFCFDDPQIVPTLVSTRSSRYRQRSLPQEIRLLQRALLLHAATTTSIASSTNSSCARKQQQQQQQQLGRRHYAISPRLIAGIQYCYQKYHTILQQQQQQQQIQPQQQIPPDDDADDDQPQHSLLRSDNDTTTTTTTEVAPNVMLVSVLAQLLYTIHIQIPLQCCLSTTTLPQAIQYLGSCWSSMTTTTSMLQPPQVEGMTTTAIVAATTAITPGPSHAVEEEQRQYHGVNGNQSHLPTNGTVDVRHQQHPGNDVTVHNNQNGAAIANGNIVANTDVAAAAASDDTDSLMEVFAEESDDSDYEFDEFNHNHVNVQNSYTNNNDVIDVHGWITRMESAYDPIQLSQPSIRPNESITWQHVSTSIHQLLSSVATTTSSSSSSSTSFLSSIRPMHWKERNLSEPMQQLCIALLIPSSSQHSPALLVVVPSPDANSFYDQQWWQPQLGVRLINTFREMILHHINTVILASSSIHVLVSSTSTTSGNNINSSTDRNNKDDNDAILSILEDFLRLIRILLQQQADASNSSTGTSLSTTTKMTTTDSSSSSPAVLVGLSSLSSLCIDLVRLQQQQQQQQPDGITNPTTAANSGRSKRSVFMETVTRTVQGNVIDLCHELTDLLEQSLSKGIDDMIAIQWTYLSLFQILTVQTKTTTTAGGKTIYRNIDASASTTMANTMPNEYAQRLLNSGLFRQWLLVWSQLQKPLPPPPPSMTDEKISEQDSSRSSCCTAVQDCILELCIASPTLLGKYAWRFPGLSEFVLTATRTTFNATSTDFTTCDRSHIHVLLWNLLGVHFASTMNQSTAPTIQWKKPFMNVAVSSPTNNYQEQTWVLFQSMCSNTVRIVTDWRIRVDHNIDRMTNSGTMKRSNQLLELMVTDWNHLSNRLVTSRFVSQLFFEVIEQQHHSEQRSNNVDQDDTTTQSKIVNVVSSTIHGELQPIQRLLNTQFPIAKKEKKVDDNTSADHNESSDEANMRRVDVENDDFDDDDDDNRNDHDKIVKIKMALRDRLNMKQEMKWIGILRKSMKDILATMDNIAVVVAASNGVTNEYVTISNKTD